MKFTRRHFLGLSAAAAGGVLLARQPWRSDRANSDAIAAALTPVRSRDGLLDSTLTARRSRLTLGGETIDTLAYNGLATGDLLEVRPGDRLRIALDNQLDEPTNLHFHGLHIPPTGTGDDVFRHVPPGSSYTYEFQLAPDHPATLAYYHPHKHGLVAKQVFGGLGGAIVVRGDLDAIPEIQAAREEIVILKDFDRDFARSPRAREHLQGRHGEFLTVNGRQNPRWTLPENGLLRLRLLNASTAREYRLALEDHPLYLIGTDGGAIERPVELREIALAPGERADVLVRGDRQPGTYRLLDLGATNPMGRGMMGRGMMGRGMGDGMGDGMRDGMGRGMHGMRGMHGARGMQGNDREAIPLATVEYGAAIEPVALPDRLTTIEPLPEPTTTHRITLGHGMGDGGMGNGGMVFLLNGQMFDPDRVDVRAQLGQVEDWEIANRGMTAHPFHIHVNSFQVVSRNDRPEPFRAWKDTVRVNPGEVVRLRTRYDDFPGKTVFHCHILDHEDSGMMGILDIQEA